MPAAAAELGVRPAGLSRSRNDWGGSMGIEAVITVVPRSEYRKQPRKQDLPRFEIVQWGDLEDALEEIGKPVSMALRGKPPFSDYEDPDYNFFIVTPALAKKISKALSTIPNEKLLAVIHEQRKKHGWRLRKYEHKYALAAFETLKQVYQMAARQGAYLEILFD
jgi:hypothetical protein